MPLSCSPQLGQQRVEVLRAQLVPQAPHCSLHLLHGDHTCRSCKHVGHTCCKAEPRIMAFPVGQGCLGDCVCVCVCVCMCVLMASPPQQAWLLSTRLALLAPSATRNQQCQTRKIGSQGPSPLLREEKGEAGTIAVCRQSPGGYLPIACTQQWRRLLLPFSASSLPFYRAVHSNRPACTPPTVRLEMHLANRTCLRFQHA